MEVNIHHAKTNLSRLIVQAEAGEEVIIARAGKPAVKLVPVQTPTARKFKAGALKGRLFVPDNFLDPDPELESLFYDGPIFPGEDSAPGEVAMSRKASSRNKTNQGRKVRTRTEIPAKRARTRR